ncbi:MAG TPA: hypothetical protein VG013_33595 [Gemmataceae bacterium]|nr:hypothetical protein [Gemmataceae bacterium]
MPSLLTSWLRRLGGTPCFRVYGKARREADWRLIDIYATHRRDADSRWPLWGGTCITWTAEVIVVGWDFAESVVREQAEWPASREHPVEVAGGRIRDPERRRAAGGPSFASASEVLAHECGHTWQVLRLGAAYLPLVGSVTLFREGPRPWNRFENEASEQGQFGGIINGSVCAALMERVAER